MKKMHAAEVSSLRQALSEALACTPSKVAPFVQRVLVPPAPCTQEQGLLSGGEVSGLRGQIRLLTEVSERPCLPACLLPPSSLSSLHAP